MNNNLDFLKDISINYTRIDITRLLMINLSYIQLICETRCKLFHAFHTLFTTSVKPTSFVLNS